jgi:hypothetical protein
MPKRVYAGSHTIKLVFLKVKSGMEKPVYDDINQKISSAGISLHKIYKVFGKFDLLLIYQTGDKSLLFTGLIPHVIYSEVFDCYTWQTMNPENLLVESFDFNKLNNTLLGMVFLKIKPNIFKRLGAEIDLTLTEALNGTEIMVLGGFGWSDAIFLITDNSIVSLGDDLLNLSGINISTNSKIERLSSDTYTMICIDFAYCNELLHKKKSVKNKPYIISKDNMERYFAELSITFNPEYENSIVTSSQSIFDSKAYHILERPEITMTVKSLEWPDFISKLLEYRRSNRNKICSTYVNISTESKQLKDNNRRPEKAESIDVDKYLPLIPQDDFGRNIVTILYFINHYSLDSTIMSSFIPIRKFITKYLEYYLKSFEQNKVSGRDELSRLMDLVKTAATQRLSGSDIYKKEAFVTFYDYKGGIQKILSAIEVLPKNILLQMGYEWAGFVVVGSAPDYRHDMDIINIPSNACLDPSKWWGIFHETAHIYGLEDKQFSDDILMKYVKECFNIEPQYIDGTQTYDVASGTSFGSILRCFMEIIADAFDFRFCFLAKEELYIKTVWSYLLIEHKGRLLVDINTYIVRTYFAIMINNIIEGQECNDTVNQLILDRLILEIKAIDHFKKAFDIIDETSIMYSLKNMQSFISYVAKVLSDKTELFNKQLSYYESDEFTKISTFISEGCVYYKKIVYPHLIILFMLNVQYNKGKEFGLPSRLAAIKTLWYQSLFD